MRRPTSTEAYTLATRVMSALMLAFGAAIVVVTLSEGGGPGSIGFLIGLAFVALGGGRFYLTLRGRR